LPSGPCPAVLIEQMSRILNIQAVPFRWNSPADIKIGSRRAPLLPGVPFRLHATVRRVQHHFPNELYAAKSRRLGINRALQIFFSVRESFRARFPAVISLALRAPAKTCALFCSRHRRVRNQLPNRAPSFRATGENTSTRARSNTAKSG